ncbi:MAG: hypothetical protein ACKOOG_04445, partial [Actinomycetota bacterium]
RWAGHRKLHTVYDLHGHLLPGDAHAAREAVGAILDAAQGRRRRAGEVIALNACRRRAELWAECGPGGVSPAQARPETRTGARGR